jgi:cysteine desulfurase
MSVSNRTYLDFNATAPVLPAARDAALEALAQPGNASSIHAEGRKARALVERARAAVAELAGARPAEVVFTSGGTEAVNLAISGIAAKIDYVIVSAIEHPAVMAAAQATGLEIGTGPVDPHGVLDLAAFETLLTQRAPRKALACIMRANNETGALQPVSEAAGLVHSHDGLILTDAVQAAGKIPIDFAALDTDLMAVSAHKIGGFAGCGALIIRDGLELEPLITGGGQELYRRGGTENLAGICAFGAAAQYVVDRLDKADELRTLRGRLEGGVLQAGGRVEIFAGQAERLPNTLCFAHRDIAAETALIALDMDGIAVSSGSACSSGKVAASHVLAAMGVEDKMARGALRVSLGHGSRGKDVERFLTSWRRLVARAANKDNSAAA